MSQVWALAAALHGCASESNLTEASSTGSAPSSPVTGAVDLRFNVFPSLQQLPGADGESAEATFRALPQTFVRPATPGSVDLRVGQLELIPPVFQTGSVVGYKINPLVVALPGESGPVDGRVRFSLPGSLQSYVAFTDSEGDYGVWTVPQEGYQVQVIPDDPMLAMYSGTIAVTSPPVPFDIDLGVGAPIYGRVTSAGFGMSDAQVRAVDPAGVTSSVALTDGSGLYQLRVTPGTWQVICDGRDGREPTLDLGWVEVPEEGVVVDVAYPVMPTTFVEGRIEDATGNPIEDATVRFVFEDADGFSKLAASWTGEDVTDGLGGFLLSAIPGTYTIEVIPSEEGLVDAWSPKRITGQAFTAPKVTLRLPIELDPLILVSGQVFAEATGAPLPSAHVTCTEIGFGERSFDTFTEVDGTFYLNTSTARQRCEIAPPSNGVGLATIRREIDPSVQSSGYDFILPPGTLLTGTVSLNGVPEPYAVVEVWSDQVRLGTSVTLEDGRFELQIDLTDAR